MKKLLISALVILPISSWAAWEITSIEPDQAIYHDKETKQKDKSLVKMWTMTDFPETREAEFGSFQSFKSLDVFDCSKKRHAFTNAVFFADKLASGYIVHTITKDANRLAWRTIKNQSASEIEWKIACEQ